MYNRIVKKIIASLLALGMLASCSPVLSGLTDSNQAPVATRPSSSPLPFPDAAANSWQAALREFFTAVRSMQLSEIENLTVLNTNDQVTFNFKLDFTPLERQKVTKLFAFQGQRTLEGFFCETIRTVTFDSVQKISETENRVVVYFTYRTADLPNAEGAYIRGTTFKTIEQQFNAVGQLPRVEEAQWSFTKHNNKFVLSVETSIIGARLKTPLRFLLDYELEIKRIISQQRL